MLVIVVTAVETSDMFVRYMRSQAPMYQRDLATAVIIYKIPPCILRNIWYTKQESFDDDLGAFL